MLKEELRHTHFPYCITKLENGTYIVLNRNYKPIGFMTDEWLVYEDQPVGMKLKGLTPKKAAQLDHQGRENVDSIYLYGDGCVPTSSKKNMDAYLARLGILMKLKIAG